MNEVRLLGRQDFVLLYNVQNSSVSFSAILQSAYEICCSASLLFNVWQLFSGIKRPGRDTGLSFSFSTVRNAWNYTCVPPYIRVTRRLDKHQRQLYFIVCYVLQVKAIETLEYSCSPLGNWIQRMAVGLVSVVVLSVLLYSTRMTYEQRRSHSSLRNILYKDAKLKQTICWPVRLQYKSL
jgi:hypothetical protein